MADTNKPTGLPSSLILAPGTAQFLGALLKPVWDVAAPLVAILLVLKLGHVSLSQNEVLTLGVLALLIKRAGPASSS